MANKTSLLCNATFRSRSQAGSLLALRAVARSAQPVQSVAAQSAARRASDPMAAVDAMNYSVAAGGKAMHRSPCSVVANLLWAGWPQVSVESYLVVSALFRALRQIRRSRAIFNNHCVLHQSRFQSAWWLALRKLSLQCWLTHRSTGPIAACRHLG